MTDDADTPIALDASVETSPEVYEHPDDLTETEAAAGHAIWEDVDDLDDDSDGLTDVTFRTFATTGRTEALRRARIVRQCLLDAGVPEVSIEVQEGRPDSNPWNACQPIAVYSHHIASHPTPDKPTPGLALVKSGRSDLPGPLANGTAGVDLVYRILTMGLANHPGTGGPLTLRGPMGSYTIPKDIARAYAWGTEYEGGFDDATWDRVYTNKRTGTSMTFREFMGRANAGLLRAVWLINGRGKSPGDPGEFDLSGYHCEHKTWAPGRKPDRLNYSTETGRAEVRKYDDGGDDVAAKDVWEYGIQPIIDGAKAKAIPAGRMLAQAHKRAAEAKAAAKAADMNAAAALRQSKANAEAIRKVAEGLDAPARKAVVALLGPDVNEAVARAEDFPDEDGDTA